jgi:hypothetical protein
LAERGGDLKLTEIDDETVMEFLTRLANSRLVMPDGQSAVLWLDARLKLRLSQAEGQRGESWERVRVRLRYMLAKLASILAQMSQDDIQPEQEKAKPDSGLIVEA